jgi:UDP-galactopyranose mutase
MFDWMIVGAGFAGSVLAERIATELDETVLLIDRRNHIGGNAYDRYDQQGILIHQYGPHIFHTNSAAIYAYLSRFTAWRAYEHRVLAQVGDQQLPIPINRTTLNALYGLNLQSEEAAENYLNSVAELREPIRSSEDIVLARVGRDLYEKFFRGYTRKQWGIDPAKLDKAVTARVPTRTNTDDRYFTDTYQAMPRDGYTRMFERMLDHPNISILLQTDFSAIAGRIQHRRLIYTGPIDQYFGYQLGALPYRSLNFVHKMLDEPWHQSVGVVNYPDGEDYTRVTEYKHLTGQSHGKTSITYEYPSDTGDPYYPVPTPETKLLYERYRALADASDTLFVGRLATYRYYNMDQIVGQALAMFERIKSTRTMRRPMNGYRPAPLGSTVTPDRAR